MEDSKADRRTFRPADERTLYINVVSNFTRIGKRPIDSLQHNPGWNLTHLNSFDTRYPDTPQADLTSLVISLHAISTNPDHAGYGVYFAPKSVSSFACVVAFENVLLEESLTLQAANNAIHLIVDRISHSVAEFQNVKRFVIMTYSTWLHDGITRDIFASEAKEYLDEQAEYIDFFAHWRMLHENVKDLEAFGISIKWWLVGQDDEFIMDGNKFTNNAVQDNLRENKDVSWGIGQKFELDPKENRLKNSCANYYLHGAQNEIDSQVLISDLGLELLGSDAIPDIPMIVRRMVVAREDTPENFALLFGDGWNDGTFGINGLLYSIKKTIKSARPFPLSGDIATAWALKVAKEEEEAIRSAQASDPVDGAGSSSVLQTDGALDSTSWDPAPIPLVNTGAEGLSIESDPNTGVEPLNEACAELAWQQQWLAFSEQGQNQVLPEAPTGVPEPPNDAQLDGFEDFRPDFPIE